MPVMRWILQELWGADVENYLNTGSRLAGQVARGTLILGADY